MKNDPEKEKAYDIVLTDVMGKFLAERDLENIRKPTWRRILFKCRRWKAGPFELVLFQDRRYELGFSLDISEAPYLFGIDLIFIHLTIFL